MADRTITLTENAYRRLRAHKTANESFSDVILRLTKRRPLASFAGILSKQTADAVRKATDQDREARGGWTSIGIPRDELPDPHPPGD